MHLQYYNARTHTSVATSAAINGIGFEVLHPPGLLGALKKHAKEIISHVMMKFKLLQQNDLKNSLKNSIPMGSKNLFSAGGIISKERGTTWKHEVQKTKYTI
jgi:hypothetical protein